MKIYRLRNKETGEFINPTRRARGYWKTVGSLRSVITKRAWSYCNTKELIKECEIVEFDCIEVKTHEI